jgi:hypothetical protein
MSGKSLLGTISPLYGAISGEGAMGKLLNPSEAKRIAEEEQARNAAAAEQANAERQAKEQAAGGGMKKGGKVKSKSASSRADGIAQRGKTRGKLY